MNIAKTTNAKTMAMTDRPKGWLVNVMAYTCARCREIGWFINYSEIDVRVEESERSHETIMAEVRERLAYMPGVLVNVGQPISHRIDHLLSGVRAQIAVKVFGTDLAALRTAALTLHDSPR